ncbi:MAG: hypothetical protein ABSA85_08605 [Terracidiphilus sp.]
MPWKLTPVVASLVAAMLLIWLHWRKSGKVRDAIDRSDGSVEFTPDPLAYFALPAIVLLPAWAAFNDYERHGSGKFWGLLLLAVMLSAAAVELFKLPGTVAVVYDGLTQHFWLRGEKRIRWGEITEIKDGVFGGSLTITGTDGTKIVYSDQLADRPRFLEELGRYVHGKLPPKKPAETLLNLQSGRKSK